MKYINNGDLIYLTETDNKGFLIDDRYYKIIDIKDEVILTLKGRYSYRSEIIHNIKIISLYNTNICKHTNEWIKDRIEKAWNNYNNFIDIEYCCVWEESIKIFCKIKKHVCRNILIEKLFAYSSDKIYELNSEIRNISELVNKYNIYFIDNSEINRILDIYSKWQFDNMPTEEKKKYEGNLEIFKAEKQGELSVL